MADGQAETPAPETLDDLAEFLVDNPTDPQDETTPPKQKPASPGTDEGNDADTLDPDAAPAPESEDEPEEPDEEPEDEAEKPDDRTSERKLKVTIKGDDGADQTLELPEAEVVKGYMRQADYTRGKQELATKENEAFQVATDHVRRRSAEYLEQSQKQLMTLQALAAVRSPEEMAALAHSDPGMWVQEQERMRAIGNVAGQIEASIAAEKQQAEQQQQQLAQQQFAQAWGTLGQAGIDKPKLKAIFDSIKAGYGIPDERFANINDPKLVFIMRDAAAYRALQEKKAAVTQKAKDAPRLPPQRQSAPRNERLAKRINDRFKGGHAKLDDLAAFIAINKI